ncbi:MAG: XdhC family protein [Chloroflexota bacterium]
MADPNLLALELLEQHAPFCLATVVDAGVSTGARAGQKLIVRAGGKVDGGIGSNALTATLARLAAAQLAAGEIRLARVTGGGEPLPDRRSRRAEEIGVDEVEVSLEPMLPPDQLVIFGAGHIGTPLCRLAAVLGFEVTIVDDRERFANRERFPDAARIVVEPFGQAIQGVRVSAWTYLVLVTRGHEHDEATLRHVVGSPAPYIGMIGSRRRVLVVFERLRALGVSEEFIRRIYAPIGVDVGARSPEEIALAILAEIVCVKRGGRAPSLRDLLPEPRRGRAARV